MKKEVQGAACRSRYIPRDARPLAPASLRTPEKCFQIKVSPILSWLAHAVTIRRKCKDKLTVQAMAVNVGVDREYSGPLDIVGVVSRYKDW